MEQFLKVCNSIKMTMKNWNDPMTIQEAEFVV